MSKVEFNMENWDKCLCRTCPVQADSKCVSEKKMKAMEMMPKLKESKMMPDPEMVPGVYCANGKATCTDIDTSKPCNCTACSVWRGYDLVNGRPVVYFCTEGAAR